MRKYDLVCFDMDGVLTDLRSSWYWIHLCLDVDNEDTYRAYCNGEIDQEEFMRRDVSSWKRVLPDIGEKDLIRFLREMPLIGGIQETIACLRANGIKSVIISGGIDLAAKMIADEFGFDDYVADGLVTDEKGRLTGEGIMTVDLRDKGIWVREFISRYGTVKERTVSIGNSHTDIPMFENSGMSIAFNPTDVYTEEASDHIVRSKNIADILDLIIGEEEPV